MTKHFRSGAGLALCVSMFAGACGGRVSARTDLSSSSAEGAGGSGTMAAGNQAGAITNPEPGAPTTPSPTVAPIPTGAPVSGAAGTPSFGGRAGLGGSTNIEPPSSNAGAPAGGASGFADGGTSFPGFPNGGSTGIPGFPDGGLGAGGSSPSDILRSYVTAPTALNGHLIGARWTGSEESVSLIDPATAQAEVVGALGDLYMWSGGLVYDRTAHVVYAVGEDRASAVHLYSLSLDSGQSGSIPFERRYTFGDVTDDGRIIGAYWTGSVEEVVLIDPATGNAATAGTLGDLTWWSGQLAYDRDAHMVHALGETDQTGTTYSIYSLSLDTGATNKVPLDRSYTVSRVTHAGRIMAAYWTGSAEPLALIDPTSGIAAAPSGFFGDLMWWQGQLIYDPAAHIVYALGQDPGDVAHIYHVDLGG